MNYMQLQCWLYGKEEKFAKDARYFFEALRDGIDRGKPFPFKCPYQVYLLRNRQAPEYIVATRVMMGTPGDDSSEQDDGLKRWFDDCGAIGGHEKIGKSSSWNWKASYDCLDSFGPDMITVTIEINRSINTVWEYFTKPANWINWYGGGLKEVTPGWQKGAKLVWSLGGSSPIEQITPGKELCISGAWMDTTYIFKPNGKGVTVVKVVESDPKGGASFSDGGAAHKANWEKTLRKLKESIESDTSAMNVETSSDKKWWAFWK
jgi:uncharacterized protein YndB with AHSA1/START domain